MRWGVAATAALLTLDACARNPVTGKRELSLVSEAQEIALGRDSLPQIEQSLGYYDDQGLADYISSLGQRLARNSERPRLPWEFHVVDSPVVNAFAVPGGFIYLTRGILAHLDSEAALVGILGHEIGHVTAKHSVRQISRAQLAGLGTGLGSVFVPEIRPFSDLLSGGLGLLFLKFGRDDERQADDLGVRYALAQGYQAKEMAEFFEVMDRLGERAGGRIPSWASTHPAPEERKERILSYLGSTSPSGELRVGGDEYKRRIDGVVYGEDPRQGFLEGSRFKHPTLRFELAFPEGWKVENSRQQVYALAPAQDAALQLTASSLEGGVSLETHARRFFQANRIRYGDASRERIGSFEAFRALFQASGAAAVVSGEAAFIQDGGTVYAIVGYAPEARFQRYQRTIAGCILSFSRLTDRKALDAQPDRIRLYRVTSPMTLEDAVQAGSGSLSQLEDMALLNNLRPGARLEPGLLLKVVRSGG